MLPYNARTKDRGFTALEILIALVIAGVLAAIAAPSFLSMFNKNKVNDALTQVRGALREAQREAIRKSKSCTLTIDTTKKDITANPTDCLPIKPSLYEKRDASGNCIESRVAIATNLTGTPPQFKFSFRGNTNKLGTIVVYSSDNTTNRMGCLVVSNGIGMIRTGNYDGSTATVDSNDCHTTEDTTE
ncbi:MAG: hypothetical protein N4J56_001733 [Chroococcidiopsis sp. SAG 2025]|uniref:pilus assembly FimT family protein n=1 Tax=Chroococcidiopsis sp. SAG 2025 TaxID=171389 RepID=UPI0029370B3E|nr:type II secretion system protein [Chroococcidiopsis sp. SAG 2025]MDV2992079.1 hypothetical protein [Chroococcidiopsis sp. SAG 2025]